MNDSKKRKSLTH